MNQKDDCKDVNECTAKGNAKAECKWNENCVNTDGSYVCNCNDGWAKDNSGNCVDVDECKERDICGNEDKVDCINTNGSYR